MTKSAHHRHRVSWSNRECIICGSKAIGINFGAPTCAPCKGMKSITKSSCIYLFILKSFFSSKCETKRSKKILKFLFSILII